MIGRSVVHNICHNEHQCWVKCSMRLSGFFCYCNCCRCLSLCFILLHWFVEIFIELTDFGSFFKIYFISFTTYHTVVWAVCTLLGLLIQLWPNSIVLGHVKLYQQITKHNKTEPEKELNRWYQFQDLPKRFYCIISRSFYIRFYHFCDCWFVGFIRCIVPPSSPTIKCSCTCSVERLKSNKCLWIIFFTAIDTAIPFWVLFKLVGFCFFSTFGGEINLILMLQGILNERNVSTYLSFL